MARRGTLERPWVRTPLMRDLAASSKTQAALAAKYGVDQSAVSVFNARHAAEITALAAKLNDAYRAQTEDEWADLWVARKRERLTAYQESIERISATLERFWAAYDGDGAAPSRSEMRTASRLLAEQAKLLRQVAAEIGDLRQPGPVEYVVEGVNLADLT